MSSKSFHIPMKPLIPNKRGRLIANMRDDIRFGIFGVDKNKLKENILSICRWSTRKKVNGLPNVRVGHTLKIALLELLQGEQPDVSELTNKDKLLIGKLIKQSHVIGLDPPKTLDTLSIDELKQRLIINIGEIASKNDSKKNKEEARAIIKILEDAGELSDVQAHHYSSVLKL